MPNPDGKLKILITDDDQRLCFLLKEELANADIAADTVNDGKDAIEVLKRESYDLLLLDLNMKVVGGEEVLKYVKEHYPSLPVIIVSGKSEVRTAIHCIKQGAFDFVEKPYEFDELLLVIKRAVEYKELVASNTILSSRLQQHSNKRIIGNSPPMKNLLHMVERAARSDSNILLQGETGCGKELFAELIHKSSARSTRPFVVINCASLPDQLIESELFGYEKGAFTDAKTSKQGLVEIADGGTLFLDEIGEMSLSLQPKLLRFLENGEFRRIGGVASLSSRVRVIGATNKNLAYEAEQKTFRSDLLYRLNVVTLTIPPLRERGNDILLLAEHFLVQKSPIRAPKTLSNEAKSALMRYNFPGNVRELHHIIERSIIFSDGPVITAADLGIPQDAIETTTPLSFHNDQGYKTMDEVEKEHIQNVLEACNWNRELTSRTLGISQKTLYTKIKKYGLNDGK